MDRWVTGYMDEYPKTASVKGMTLMTYYKHKASWMKQFFTLLGFVYSIIK